jgi:hypothetical protein
MSRIQMQATGTQNPWFQPLPDLPLPEVCTEFKGSPEEEPRWSEKVSGGSQAGEPVPSDSADQPEGSIFFQISQFTTRSFYSLYSGPSPADRAPDPTQTHIRLQNARVKGPRTNEPKWHKRCWFIQRKKSAHLLLRCVGLNEDFELSHTFPGTLVTQTPCGKSHLSFTGEVTETNCPQILHVWQDQDCDYSFSSSTSALQAVEYFLHSEGKLT